MKLREIQPGDLVAIWPNKYKECIYGTIIAEIQEAAYEVFADEKIWTLPRKDIFVDDEIPVKSPTFSFPAIRKVFPQLMANEIVSIQPMTRPSSSIFYMDFGFSEALKKLENDSEKTK